MSKYKITILCLFIISLLILIKVKAEVTSVQLPLLDKKIYIDPGHDCIGNSKYIKNYL